MALEDILTFGPHKYIQYFYW